MRIKMRGMSFFRVFLTILTILLLSILACSKKGAHRFTTSTGEDGVEICVNSGGPKVSEPLYDVEETLSLGGEEPEPTLFQPYNFLIGDDSMIYISDDNRIKKFDPDGQFLHYIGNPGEGPGEINYPRLEKIFGDSLIVGQYRWSGRGKYEIFNLNGEFIDRMYLPAVEEKLIPEGRNSVDLFLRNKTYLFHSSASREQGEYELSSYSYGLVNFQGEFIHDLNIEILNYPESVFGRTENTSWGMSRPYMSEIQIRYFGESLYALLPEGNEIVILTQSGDRKRKIQLDIPSQPITQEDREERKAYFNRPDSPILLKDSYFPDHKPLACDFLVDDNRNIWLKKGIDFYNYGKKPVTYMILNENGEYIADQTLPMNLSEVKNEYAYGFFVTEDDLRIFKKYKLKQIGN